MPRINTASWQYITILFVNMIGLVVCFMLNTYVALYVFLFLILALNILHTREKTTYLLLLSITVYLSIGLLNISHYRNYASVETIRTYTVAILCLLLPLSAFPSKLQQNLPNFRSTSFLRMMVFGHIIISWLFVLMIYTTKGVVIVNQDLRFGIPTSVGYAIRSCQFIPVYLLCLDKNDQLRKLMVPIVVLSVLPTVLIASRSTVFLIFLSMLFYQLGAEGKIGLDIRKRKNLSPFKKMVLYASVTLAAVLLIGGGFYLRRAGTDQLMSGFVFIAIYMENIPFWLAIVLAPFHQGFNETIALTSRIVDFGYYNHFTSTPLLLADFENLLGISSVSAAQHFASFIGRAQDGGLTPGLIGGVLLDYPSSYPLFFLCIGLVLAKSRAVAMGNLKWLVFHSILLTQFIHLFHRGFVKPEYVTILIIAGIYLSQMRRSHEY